MKAPDPIICTGCGFTDEGQSTGEPCGKVFRPSGWPAAVAAREQAWAAGWHVSPPRPDGTYDAMCPRCARPDPAIAAGLRQPSRKEPPCPE